MPLVRCEVKNEYGLGKAELYKKEVDEEDPKAILDGVAVSGLVGILRQLGDLAEFAAEVFHGLQEQVMTTASRSHKLMARVQSIESELPHIEKAALAQTSHLHFCYTAGSDWHTHIQNQHNHFIYGDLPRFIMDSYEECREPPRLHMLDRFDSGGPGSCLKRYSDPSYFKKVSARSDDITGYKSQRHKVRKSKKKRSAQRNGEILNGASLSAARSRMPFAPTNARETSPAHSASTMGRTLNSDPEERAHSFDSRTDAGYIECVFHPSSSIQPTEEGLDESHPNQQPAENLDETFADEHIKVHDDFPSRSLDEQSAPSHSLDEQSAPSHSLDEQSAPSHSSVTWEEKVEIETQFDHEDASEMVPTCSVLGTEETMAVNPRQVDLKNTVLDVEDPPIPVGDELDEIQSETDDFVDALNTIESESETDLDCHTKHEVDPYPSSLKSSEINDELCTATEEHESDHHPSTLESHVDVKNFSDEDISYRGNGISLESAAQEETTAISGTSDRDFSAGIDNINDGFSSVVLSSESAVLELKDPAFEGIMGSDLETESLPQISSEDAGFVNQEPLPIVGKSERDCSSCADYSGNNVNGICSEVVNDAGSTLPNSQNGISDGAIHSAHQTQLPPAQTSSAKPVSFWTNGSLLGLQPSKPPVFAVPSAVSLSSVTGSKDETVAPSAVPVITDNLEDFGTRHVSVGSTSRSTIFSLHNRCDLDISSSVASGTGVSSIADDKVVPDVFSNKNHKDASQVSGLGYKLFMNGYQMKPSALLDDESEHIIFQKSGSFGDKSEINNVAHKTSREMIFEQFTDTFHINSPNSSPPLGHMKVSFHPADGFKASKLKLKFHDEVNNQELNGDMFPSFQLVPEPDNQQHEIGSASDDDMFCKPSPSRSDGCLSYYSESNSEQWESNESPRSKDQELYDSFGQILSVESASSPLESDMASPGCVLIDPLEYPDSEGVGQPTHCLPSTELPTFDTMNPSIVQTKKQEIIALDSPASQKPIETVLPPPPPPPPHPSLPWMVSQVSTNVTEGTQNIASEVHGHAFSMKVLGPTVPEVECKPDSFERKMTEPTIGHKTLVQGIDGFRLKSKQLNQQKFNADGKANQQFNDKEGEDFLHQIRTQSNNLRRTTPVRSNSALAPSANFKVTAILEKANAIRQAVTSDDGEDNWSDTSFQ